MTHQILRVILHCLPEKGRKGTEVLVDVRKERNRGQSMKEKVNGSAETEEILICPHSPPAVSTQASYK